MRAGVRSGDGRTLWSCRRAACQPGELDKCLLVVQLVSIGVILACVWFVKYGRLWWWILTAFAAIAYFSAVIARRRTGRRGGMRRRA